ncbi:MAG: toxin-antitoxin system HicB family antitoxin [Nitrospirales bacterium]|nr:toxin-antitoxin system HicB family antitoxin [Nitrospirales bacterium]
MGREPLKPASGKLMLRIFPEVHAKALMVAKASGKSLNQWAAEVLDKAAHMRRHR